MSTRLQRIYRGETTIDFIGRRRIWFALSGLFVLTSIILLSTRSLNYGIEFKGGLQVQAPIPADGPLGDASDLEVIQAVEDSVAQFDPGETQVQVATGDARSVILQTKEIDDPDVQNQVVSTVAETVGAEVADTDSSRIGSKWGAEITRKALRALVIFLIVVFAFISLRFDWKMALAALASLVHDLLITAGVYSFVGFEVTPSTVIAILTILGYSLYDVVVVFDKLEEDTELLVKTGRMTYEDSANQALNEVFMRSFNTSLATIIPVATLLIVGAGLLGAQTLQDLALALLVGLLVSSYSSVFLAVPLLSMWKESEQKYRNVRQKFEREAERAAAVKGKVPAAAIADGGADVGGSRPGTSTARPPSKPKAGSKKAKRRKRR